MEQLEALAQELGTPGKEKLFKAARKKGINVSKAQVGSYLAKQGQKQIFRPLPESLGKVYLKKMDFEVKWPSLIVNIALR